VTILDWRRRSLDRIADEEEREAIKWAFRQSCVGAGVALAVDSPIAGTSWRTPEIVEVRLGSSVGLTVRMLEGQVPAQLARVGRLIAPHLGGVALRVADRGFGWAVVTVLASDPLVDPLPLDLTRRGLLVGRDEGGQDVAVDHPRDLPHLIVQGQTRSGKSIWLYALLAQAVREPDVELAGVDPSGLTLRPLPGRWVCNGLADPARIVDTLTALVGEMDSRLAAMPDDRDILQTDEDTPVVLIVLDEYPALLRALDGLKTRDNDPGKVVRTLVARMLAEAHKVGYRLVIAAQRAEASIVGAAERAQCAGRLSFRVDSKDSIALLHPDAVDYAADHTSSPPGIALCSWPGRPLTRLRGPYIGSYGDFVRAVSR
jgi:S-DNA-T family DNA segregation ATPase FtsK/SpoIIIE